MKKTPIKIQKKYVKNKVKIKNKKSQQSLRIESYPCFASQVHTRSTNPVEEKNKNQYKNQHKNKRPTNTQRQKTKKNSRNQQTLSPPERSFDRKHQLS